jgi:RNA polymerase sigma-70 factor (ECF subfamily)
MQSYQQGKIAAFDELYRRHSPKAYGYLRPRTTSRQQADDLLQSCFLKLHQSRHQFDPTQPFLPWFWTILRSVHADSLRRDLRNPARANASEDHARAQWEAIPAPSEISGSASTSGVTGPATSELLNQLSPEQRRLIELRTQRELSFKEIAEELAITPTTARQRFGRLIKTLRAQLSGKSAGRKGADHE